MPDSPAIVDAALLAVVPSVLYLVVLNAIDRYEKEPRSMLVAGVLLGGIAAPLVAMTVLAVTGRGFELTPSFAPRPSGLDPLVPIVQEVVKGAMLVALVTYVRNEFDDVLDGIVYGAAVGAGFGAAETFVYALGGTDALSGGTHAALLVSGLNHAFYTAVFGGILGAAHLLPDRGTGWLFAAYGLATAVLLHALHDALPAMMSRLLGRPDEAIGQLTRLVATLMNVLGLVTLGVVVLWALRRETGILRHHLRPELESGVIGRLDYETAPSLRHRLSRQAGLMRAGRMADLRALRRLYALEGELAFRRRRAELRHRGASTEAELDRLRDEVRRVRRELEESE